MIPGLINHLWQSTLFAGAAWLLARTLRNNRAQVRYWVWFVASVKFLIPFSIIASVGTALGSLAPRDATAATARMEWVSAWDQVESLAIPATAARAVIATETAGRDYAALAIAGLWAVGFVAIAARWLMRWRRVSVLRRSATPLNIRNVSVPAMSAPGLIEPGVFGIFRPVLLLPEGIDERLTAAQLEAIVAHELCHVRRHDNLTAAIHMAVQAVFWFHPQLWWLGSRLVEERERACDEEVLANGNAPQVYAEGILKVCEFYLVSPIPLVAGVTGANLKQRICTIMANRRGEDIGIGKRVLLAAAVVAGIAVPIAVGMMGAPPIHAQSASIQSKGAAPKFEVASIRRCPPGSSPSMISANGGGTPGHIRLVCQSVGSLIRTSYVFHANGRRNWTTGRVVPIQKLPGWVDSELYTIEAVAEGTPSPELMLGPMMQALLADRFKLKIHNEYEDVPVYDMTVASGGHKLQPHREGSCRSTSSYEPLTAPAKGQAPPALCGLPQTLGNEWRLVGATMEDIAAVLSWGSDRLVVDKTGLAGIFDAHVPLSADIRGLLAPRAPAPLPGAGDPAPRGTSQDELTDVKHAIAQKLGLHLKSAKGKSLILVVDHVERPSEN